MMIKRNMEEMFSEYEYENMNICTVLLISLIKMMSRRENE